ncbi:MAG: four helix bundle protein, partial [Actinomycetes bacterium]
MYVALRLFPKRDRYSLGSKIDTITLEILEFLFKTSVVSREQKLALLQTISAKLDLLKVLLRLAHDNKTMGTKQYLSLEMQLQEVGKMTGGWIRSLKN